MRRHGTQRGFALASVLVVGTIVSTTVVLALNMAGHRVHDTGLQQQRETSFHVAEGGVALAFAKIRRNIPFQDRDTRKLIWAYELPASGSVAQRSVTEQVTVDNRTVTVTVTRDERQPPEAPPRYTITASSNF